jgi:tRNA dimethylallyltransferase
VFLLSGQPFSSFNRDYLAAQRHDRYPAVRVGLTMPREKLYDAIDRRVDRMMAEGLLDEVKGLRAKGYGRQLPAMQAIGYAQLLAYLEGEIPLEKAVEDIKRATRQFAKRQLTWFRRDERIRWFDCEDYEEAYREVEWYVKETVFE